MKTLKYNSKIKIALFFLIFFLIIVFFNNESKATKYTSVSSLLSGGYAKNELNKGDTVTGESESAVFGNDAVYCIETGTHYSAGDYTYTLQQIIEVNSTTNSEYQPLLYIFKNYPKSNFSSSSETKPYFNNASQIAIWGTILQRPSSFSKYFKVTNGTVDKNNSGISSIHSYYYLEGSRKTSRIFQCCSSIHSSILYGLQWS